MTYFEIYPAVDLRHGQVVRLKYGDPNQQTVFDSDPVSVARKWLAAGATWIHVVNLDGAFDEEGTVKNWELLPIMTELPIRLQFGGGLRSLADIEQALNAGVSRIILGTAAVENPTLVSKAIRLFGAQHVAVGIDARHGEVKTRGWQTGAGLSPLELAQKMKSLGVTTVIHTDIGRDGVLTGVNAAASADLATQTGLEIIASGGVSSLEDVQAAAELGLAGIVIGRALYEKKFELQEAIKIRDRRREIGDRRPETRDRRREIGDRRPETRDRRRELRNDSIP